MMTKLAMFIERSIDESYRVIETSEPSTFQVAEGTARTQDVLISRN